MGELLLEEQIILLSDLNAMHFQTVYISDMCIVQHSNATYINFASSYSNSATKAWQCKLEEGCVVLVTGQSTTVMRALYSRANSTLASCILLFSHEKCLLHDTFFGGIFL